MKEQKSNIQEAQIILAFIRHSDTKGNLDFFNTNISSDLNKIVNSGSLLDDYLYDLDKSNIINYEEIGEEGFAPIIMAGITKDTHQYLKDLLKKIDIEVKDLNERITNILTFNPTELSRSIDTSKSEISEISRLILKNDLLKPLNKQVNEISKYFESLSVVSKHYEEVYKNIIRPVQEEGKSGIKATVIWAIISIIISTIISIILGNLDSIQKLFER